MKKILLIIISLILVGCVTSSDRQFSLQQTLLSYEKTIRWGEFTSLLNFRESSTEAELAQLGRYDNTRISGYQVKRQKPDPDNFTLQQDVEISYFKTHDNRIRSVLDRQKWKYDEELNRWFIHSPLPRFD